MSADDRDNTGSPALNAWLAAAREDLAARETPAWLEFQLRERLAERSALNAVHRARESQSDQTQLAPDRGSRPGARWLNGLRATFTRAPRRWPALAAAATACVALVIGLTVLSPMLPAPRGAADLQAQGERSPFIALMSLDAIAAESGATVVPAQLPRTSLVDFGLPVDPARADVPLKAEFLMSPRGVVLAVRFVE